MLNKSLEYLKQKLNGLSPDTAMILGSGLDKLTDSISEPLYINYADIPDFPQTTVAGHKGRFVVGKIGNHTVICMQGRIHLYEGIAPQLIDKIIKLLSALGVKQLIITNAAGSLNPNIPTGSIMLISDHINMSGRNPLIGTHDEPYFPDMSNAYDAQTRQTIKNLAQTTSVKLYEGVYLMTMGPNYETAAEVRMFRNFGADAVGMSTVPEVISAVHKGMKVLAFSVISNMGTGLTDVIQSHTDVLAQGAKSSAELGKLIQAYLEQQ